MAIIGILSLIGGVGMIWLAGAADWAGVIDFSSSIITALGVYSVIVGLLTLVVVFLLWTGNKLGWYLAIILLVLNAIQGIISLPTGILTLIIMAILIWYFFRPNVKEYFGV